MTPALFRRGIAPGSIGRTLAATSFLILAECVGNPAPGPLAYLAENKPFCATSTLDRPPATTRLMFVRALDGRQYALLVDQGRYHPGIWQMRGDTLGVSMPRDSVWMKLVRVTGTDTLQGTIEGPALDQVSSVKLVLDFCPID